VRSNTGLTVLATSFLSVVAHPQHVIPPRVTSADKRELVVDPWPGPVLVVIRGQPLRTLNFEPVQSRSALFSGRAAHLLSANNWRLLDAIAAPVPRRFLVEVRLPPDVDSASGDVNLVQPGGFVNERPVSNSKIHRRRSNYRWESPNQGFASLV
jgi:hypothetical protein